MAIMSERRSAADVAAEHQRDALRDAVAYYRAKLARDKAGAAAIAVNTGCCRCAIEAAVVLGIMVSCANEVVAGGEVSESARRELDEWFASFQAATNEAEAQ
jgi:phage terminase Nu1 subunit (DNA packaging protein)